MRFLISLTVVQRSHLKHNVSLLLLIFLIVFQRGPFKKKFSLASRSQILVFLWLSCFLEENYQQGRSWDRLLPSWSYPEKIEGR